MTTPTYRPKRGVFESTLKCNLNCKHCGSSAGAARGDELTTTECADLFTQLKGIGLEWITISGGEPMSRPDWAELIAAAKEAGLRVGMFTNALTLNEDTVKQAKNVGLNAFGFSVDGMEATHDVVRGKKGHFKILENAMNSAKKVGVPFSVVTTICNDNFDELEDMYQYIQDIGAYGWQVQPGSDMGNMSHNKNMLLTPAQLPVLENRISAMMKKGRLSIYPADSLGYFGPNEKTLRKITGGHCFGGCGAGTRNIGIECNGNIKGCLSMFAGYNCEGEDYVEGNIRQESLSTIWNRPGAFGYNRQWKVSDLSGFCATCNYVEKCRGGCIAKRITDGDIRDNKMCVYRSIVESSPEPIKTAKAAAVFFAASLGASLAGCDKADEVAVYGVPGPDDTTDTNDDTDTADTDTADTDTSDDTDTAGTEVVDAYGIPDTSMVVYYGVMPDSDSDSNSDSEPLLPPYSLPDTEE